MNYEQFKEDKDKRIYNSSSAEWNRMAYAKGKIVLPNQKVEDIFVFLFERFLRELNKELEIKNIHALVETNIGSKTNPVFLTKFKRNEVFEFQFKKGDQFHALTVKTNQKNFNTVVQVKRSVKLPKTRVGMNGKLGTMKYRLAVRKEIRELELYMKQQLNLK